MSQKIFNNATMGMIRKMNPLKQNQDFYSFALNISTDKNKVDRLSKVTENKLEDYYSLRSGDYIILNSLYLNIDEYLYFITDKTSSFSEIVHYNKGSINIVYDNPDLNFRASNPIESTYRVDYKGDRLVYFVDGVNKDRVINIDKPQSDNIESLSIVPVYNYSKHIDYKVLDTGSLRAGNYYILIEYLDSNGGSSFYKNIINGIPIESGVYNTDQRTTIVGSMVDSQAQALFPILTGSSEVYGTTTDAVVSKSIELNLDTEYSSDFDSMNLYIVRRYGGNEELYLRENLGISDKITISSLNQYILLDESVSDIITPNILYSRSSSITQLENRLIAANTEIEGFNVDLQKFANTIKVGYDIDIEAFGHNYEYGANYRGSSQVNNNEVPMLNGSPINEVTGSEKDMFATAYYLGNTENKNPKMASQTFMRDEVYALGVYFELTNGQFTDVYHIPGRQADTDLESHYGAVAEDGTVLNSTTAARWDTRPVTIDRTTGPAWKMINTGAKGLLGYYECDSTYPSGYGFPEGNIRHHRIPSDRTEPLLELFKMDGAELDGLTNRRFIYLTFNYTIPEELSGLIKNVFFTHAVKHENNKKVSSKGLVYVTREIDGNVRQSEALNIPVSYESMDSHRSRQYYEFTSPDVDFKFKEFNIKGDKMKINSIYFGNALYVTKAIWDPDARRWENGPKFFGSYINAEGISPSSPANTDNYIYNYKQEFSANRIKYNFVTGDLGGLKQYELSDMIFVDNNSSTSFAGTPLSFTGSQNTSVFKTRFTQERTGQSLFENDNIPQRLTSLIPNLLNDTSSGKSISSMYQGFYIEGIDMGNANNPNWEFYKTFNYPGMRYDAAPYVTILLDNDNIDADILNLDYILGTSRDYLYGDCFIDYHYTKKSYSAIVRSSAYEAMISYGRETPEAARRRGIDNIDTSASDSYIAYPVESRINIRLRKKDSDKNQYNPHIMIDSGYSTNSLEKLAGTQAEYNIDREYLNTSSLYYQYSNKVKLSELNNQTKRLENRIIYSDLQNSESIVDSFRSFRANNYKDIDTFKGAIYKLFIKDNNLHIITRDSLFIIHNSNQQLLSQEGVNVIVGSGEFLSQNPQELINLESGFAGTSSKLSFSENKYGYVFVDKIRNKIMLFNQSLDNLNDLGLEEDLSVNLMDQFPELSKELDNPLLGYGITTGFDPETDRLFVTKLDYKATDLLLNSNPIIKDGLFYIDDSLIDFNNKDYFENKSFTITFDAVNKSWISYHDYFPSNYINNPKILKLKEFNGNNSIKKYGEDYTDRFIIDVIFNENQVFNKVFDSLQFDIEVETVNKEFTEDFFDEIVVYTNDQSTGLISLNNNYPINNIVKHNNYWNFSKLLDVSGDKPNKKLFVSDWNSIKDEYFIDKVINDADIDVNKSWYKKRRFKSKYLNVRLLKKNTKNNKFNINFMIANFRPSSR